MTRDMGPLPQDTPRRMHVARARQELLGLVLDWEERQELTLCESLALLSEVLDGKLQRAMIRERGDK